MVANQLRERLETLKNELQATPASDRPDWSEHIMISEMLLIELYDNMATWRKKLTDSMDAILDNTNRANCFFEEHEEKIKNLEKGDGENTEYRKKAIYGFAGISFVLMAIGAVFGVLKFLKFLE